MHDQLEPTDEEQELASTDRQQEEEAMQYPGHEAPEQETEDARE